MRAEVRQVDFGVMSNQALGPSLKNCSRVCVAKFRATPPSKTVYTLTLTPTLTHIHAG